jgi:hypothetical protein
VSTAADPEEDPERYVQENSDTLLRIIKHVNDEWVRAMALAAIVEFGEDPDLHKVKREVDRAIERGDATGQSRGSTTSGYCPSCGEAVDVGDAFCRYCGGELPDG